MKNLFSSLSAQLLGYGRCATLLLGLSGLPLATFAQSFGPINMYSTIVGSNPQTVAVGDLNGDGRLDIVSLSALGQPTVGVLLGIAGGFAPVSSYAIGPSGTYTGQLALGDINGDGRLDIVVTTFFSDGVGVLLGLAGGGFAPVSTYSTGASSVPSGITLGDLNRDGHLDIVTANHGASAVGVLLGLASGGFTPIVTYPSGFGRPGDDVSDVALGDMNGDSLLDIVAVNIGANNTGVLLGLAGGGFAPASVYSTGPNSNPRAVTVGDVNGDSRLDIVATNGFSGNVSVLLGQANGFAPVTTYATDATNNSPEVALGDTNGDGRLDIIVPIPSLAPTSSIGILLGLAGGGFAPVSTYSTGTNNGPGGLALGDMNGDARLDVVVTNRNSTDNIGVFLNMGTFTPLATASSRVLAAAVSLYPNPAHDAFTVQVPASFGTVQADLLNALDQVVRRPSASGLRFSVDTNGLAPGIYTLHLASSAGTLAKRVVVE